MFTQIQYKTISNGCSNIQTSCLDSPKRQEKNIHTMQLHTYVSHSLIQLKRKPHWWAIMQDWGTRSKRERVTKVSPRWVCLLSGCQPWQQALPPKLAKWRCSGTARHHDSTVHVTSMFTSSAQHFLLMFTRTLLEREKKVNIGKEQNLRENNHTQKWMSEKSKI